MVPQQPSASGSSGSSDSPRSGRGLSILLMFACIVVVAAGVRSASSIITPILAAAFISMLAILPLSLLQRRLRLPRWLALLVVLGATIVYAVVGRFSRRPVTLFRQIALVTLVVSLIPDLLLLGGGMPGASIATVAPLIAMHVVAWAIAVRLLTTLARA